jgi:hypothetical protein
MNFRARAVREGPWLRTATGVGGIPGTPYASFLRPPGPGSATGSGQASVWRGRTPWAVTHLVQGSSGNEVVRVNVHCRYPPDGAFIGSVVTPLYRPRWTTWVQRHEFPGGGEWRAEDRGEVGSGEWVRDSRKW